jgi:16S rRNA (cytidine1402-2'-O)-methyltransferase
MPEPAPFGKLFVIPTPIGNLGDITLRAIETLGIVDVVLAEDTRVSRRLLNHLNIDKPIYSHHQNNEHKSTDSLVEKLLSGSVMGLISDAGTPGISDPGFMLVRACVEAGIAVETLPGATAFVPALVNSGLPCDRFVFEGFLPHKKGRATALGRIAEHNRTTVIYESPHRLLKLLGQLIEVCGEERRVSVSRELSKLYEETYRGSLKEALDYFENKGVKGEFVVVLSGE